jgi:chromosome segregation ATPase
MGFGDLPVYSKGSPNELLAKRLKHFDERLSAIYLQPLAVRDWRLIDTPFERLTEDSVTNLNEVTKKIYTIRQRLPELEEALVKLTEDIEQYEERTLSRNIEGVKNTMGSILKALKRHEQTSIHSHTETHVE